jgi:hypothetical protein
MATILRNEEEMKMALNNALSRVLENQEKLKDITIKIVRFIHDEVLESFPEFDDDSLICTNNWIQALIYKTGILDDIGIEVFAYIIQQVRIEQREDYQKIIEEAMFDKYDASLVHDKYND